MDVRSRWRKAGRSTRGREQAKQETCGYRGCAQRTQHRRANIERRQERALKRRRGQSAQHDIQRAQHDTWCVRTRQRVHLTRSGASRPTSRSVPLSARPAPDTRARLCWKTAGLGACWAKNEVAQVWEAGWARWPDFLVGRAPRARHRHRCDLTRLCSDGDTAPSLCIRWIGYFGAYGYVSSRCRDGR